MQTPYCTANCAAASLAKSCALLSLTGLSKISEDGMRRPAGGIHENSPGSPGRVPCFPLAAFGQIDYDRHVVFDNSLADGSWHYSRSDVVGPSELDRVDGKLPVDGNHYLTPPNALRLKWRSATGGDWDVTLDVRGATVGWNSPARLCECDATPKTLFPPDQSPRIMLSDSDNMALPLFRYLMRRTCRRGEMGAARITVRFVRRNYERHAA